MLECEGTYVATKMASIKIGISLRSRMTIERIRSKAKLVYTTVANFTLKWDYAGHAAR